MRRVAVVGLVSACSLTLVTRPPVTGDASTRCTESRAAPVADAVLSAGWVTVGIVALATIPKCSGNCTGSDATKDLLGGFGQAVGGVSLILLGGLFAAASVGGFVWTERCRTLHARGAPPPPPPPLE